MAQYPYLMSERYCKHWDPKMAIRELIANAVDATDYCDVSITWRDGVGCIRNSKTSLEKKHLLMGESDKVAGSIGQFGEGLKLAALVLARNKRKIWIDSGNSRYTFSMGQNEDFGCSTLFVDVQDLQDPVEGTTVYLDADKIEMGSAKQLFRAFNNVEEIAPGILEAMGDVYVTGVYICKLQNSYLGYELSDKTLLNRDRTMVDRTKVDHAVRELVSRTDSDKVIENLLLSCYKHKDSYESGLRFWPYNGRQWIETVHRIWGEKVCITSESDDQIYDTRAIKLGFKVLDFGMGMNSNLVSIYGDLIQRSRYVNPPEVSRTIQPEDLKDVEKSVLGDVKRMMELLLGRDLGRITMDVTEELSESTIFQVEGEKMFVNRRYLVKPLAWLVGGALHELAHIESGSSDCSSRFEEKMTDFLREIAEVATRKWIQ